MDAEATICEDVVAASADHCKEEDEWLLAEDMLVADELVEETREGDAEEGGEDIEF